MSKLYTPEVGNWGIRKYKLIGYYANIFSKSMKSSWTYRIYLDLYSGAGKARDRDSSNILLGSPYQALTVGVPFDKYIFNDMDPICIESLKTRVYRDFPNIESHYFNYDVNRNIQKIIDPIPNSSSISFCVVDPFKVKNLHFNTIVEISNNLRSDFLILIPTVMDIGRNEHNYSKEDSVYLDNFLGTVDWREQWSNQNNKTGKNFWIFVTNYFISRMNEIGYIHYAHEPVNKPGTKVTKYHLVFFSKNPLGKKFFVSSIKGTDNQQKLDL